MKKIIICLTLLAFILTLAACGSKSQENSDESGTLVLGSDEFDPDELAPEVSIEDLTDLSSETEESLTTTKSSTTKNTTVKATTANSEKQSSASKPANTKAIATKSTSATKKSTATATVKTSAANTKKSTTTSTTKSQAQKDQEQASKALQEALEKYQTGEGFETPEIPIE